MKTKQLLLSLIVSVIISTALQAQGFIAGDNTFNLTGSGSSDKDMDNTSFNVEFSFGHFFTKGLEGQIRQGFSIYDSPGSNDSWNGSTRGALDLYLFSESLCPFIGANIGYIYGDNVTDTGVGGPEGGVKLFLNNTTYILGLVEYQFFFKEGDELRDRFNDGRFVYSLGIGVKF